MMYSRDQKRLFMQHKCALIQTPDQSNQKRLFMQHMPAKAHSEYA